MQRVVAKNNLFMKKIILSVLVFSSVVCFGQQLTNSNMELWTTVSYGPEPNNWQYNDGAGITYGTNNAFRGFDGVDPLTSTKITGANAYGGTGNSILLETKQAIGATAINTYGYTTLPGWLYRQEAITNTNIGSITFNYKSTVVQGDSCFVRVGLIDASFNFYSLGVFWIKPSDNSTTWKTKTIILENQLPGTPTEIFIEAMSTYDGFDGNYSYTTPIIGSKLYLDNFTLNYCNSPITTNLTETICDYMLPYTWSGVTFTSAGTQSSSFTSSLGCDSTVNMTLSVFSGPYTQIPDAAFEQELIDLGYDACGIVDSQVPTNSINTVLNLFISNSDITDLTGIEDFQSLESLTVWNANLAVNGLNLSSNNNLKSLTISSAGLTSLNLSQNTLLENLNISGGISNNIPTLDLSLNTNLQTIDCPYTSISSLQLPAATSLTQLNCQSNNLSSLALSLVPNLTSLNASYNALINLGTNTHNNLITMNINNNSFSGLNLSGYTQLKSLDCSDNSLECLYIKNGNNNQFTYLNTKNNFILTCIEVDDSLFSTNNPIWNANKDAWSSYSEDCQGICITADIHEITTEEATIYPNPSEGMLNVKSSSPIEKIILTNMEGRILEVFEKSNFIDISSFKSGMYNTVILFVNGSKLTKSIIKN
jgi:Leucine-rich repeat (LRR) protein